MIRVGTVWVEKNGKGLRRRKVMVIGHPKGKKVEVENLSSGRFSRISVIGLLRRFDLVGTYINPRA